MSTKQYVDVSRTLQNLKESEIQSENFEAIQSFVNHCAAEGLSEVRQQRHCQSLKALPLKFSPDDFVLRGASEEELKTVMAELNRSDYAEARKRTREVVTDRQKRKRAERTPDRTDPRERLSRMELVQVNQEADRIAQRLRTDHSRAAVSRVLARRVARGQDITEAVFATMDELKAAPGAICPIEDVPDVPTDEVSIEGEVIELWDPSTPNVQQVGLIADDTAATKFTVWRKSDCTAVAEGERVRLRAAKVNWHQGRWSLALTYDSMIVFPERDDRWWEE
jgi:hypothetical protein